MQLPKKVKAKTIKQLHAEWAKACVPVDACEIQRREMEKAFYSGAFALFMDHVKNLSRLSDNEAMAALEGTRGEFDAYFRTLYKIPADGTSNN